VTPEAADYLSKARDDLNDTRKIAAIGLAKVAARSAYYAAFHAAEAFIVERTGKIARPTLGFARNLRDWRGRSQKSTGPFRFSWHKPTNIRKSATMASGRALSSRWPKPMMR
jgi:hypothetical protein